MPQLDLFSFTTIVPIFGVFFFLFFIVGYASLFALACRIKGARLFFSPSLTIQQVFGGAQYVQGRLFFLLLREYTLYRIARIVALRA